MIALAAAALALAAGLAPAQLRQSEEERPEQYPVAPHRDDAFYFCTACHSFRIVAAQGMSRARWDESLDWMVERHGMPRIEGAERARILDYLAGAFPERARAPGGWQNPFLPK